MTSITWRVVSRTLDPHRLYLSEPGHSNQTFAYAAAVYVVREHGYDERGSLVDMRGHPLYLHDNGDAAVLMEAIRPLMEALRRRCAERDASAAEAGKETT